MDETAARRAVEALRRKQQQLNDEAEDVASSRSDDVTVRSPAPVAHTRTCSRPCAQSARRKLRTAAGGEALRASPTGLSGAPPGVRRDVVGAVACQVAQREHQLARERERQAAGRVKAAQAGDAAARQQADQLRCDARALGNGPIRQLERWLALPRVCSPRSDFFYRSFMNYHYLIV